ncbi:MAG: hypothetical protein AAGC46_11400 [Solirubrobacteraceae bacterium]|nr:hypothetical protein [Patulibacter sp.]
MAGFLNAGQYTVWSCADGDGNPAPTEGWVGTVNTLAGNPEGSFQSTCGGQGAVALSARQGAVQGRATSSGPVGQPRAISAFFNGTSDSVNGPFTGRAVTLAYHAAPFTLLARFGIERSGWAVGQWGGRGLNGLPMVSTDDTMCQVSGPSPARCTLPAPTHFMFGTSGLESVYGSGGIGVGCGDPSGAASGSRGCWGDGSTLAEIDITRALAVLSDGYVPQVGTVGGVPATATSGQLAVSFGASDNGSGVFSGYATIDDQKVWQSTADQFDECSPQQQAAGFRKQVPCPTSTTELATIDTTKVSNGSHVLALYATDAGGNVSQPVKKTLLVDNPVVVPTPTPISGGSDPTHGGGPTPTPTPGSSPLPGVTPNGGAAPLSIPKGAQIRAVGYGRPLHLRGTLKDAKKHPIANATLDVAETATGAPPVKVATITTDAKGRYAYSPGTLTSARLFTFTVVSSTGPAATPARTVAVKVVAAVTLKVDHASAQRGKPVTFSGTVSAGTLPGDGVRVVVEAWDGHRWLLGGVPRTNAAGAFAWTHRFRTAIRYRFRARVLAGAGLTVDPGTSADVRVSVH